MKQFIWNTITTNALEASVRFYTELLGLSVERRFISPQGVEFVFMKDDGHFEIELIAPPGGAPSLVPPSNLSIGLAVDNFEAMVTKISDFGLSLEGDVVTLPQIRFCFVKDPNGVTIQLVDRP